MELSKLMSDFSSVPLAQHETLLVIGSLVALYFAVVFLEKHLKGKTTGLKDNTLNIDVGAKKAFMTKIALGIAGLCIVLFFEFYSAPALYGFYLTLLVAGIYIELLDHAPGIYKNGKYLGTVYTAFIKVGNGLTLGKRQGTETVGSLKILRNGWRVAELNLTAEGFMELSPDKIHEVFPEIRGKIERFKDLFKVGDYTLQYTFFQKSANASYQEVANTSNFDDDTGGRLEEYHDLSWSSLPGNVWHDTFNHH